MWVLIFAGCERTDPAPAACVAPLLQTGSSTMVSSPCSDALWMVHPEEGVVTVFDIADGAARSVHVGVDPARITRAGGRYFVSLAGEAAVAVVEDLPVVGPQVVGRFSVGGEPFGVLAAPDGASVYVAVSLEDRVEERDARTYALLRSWWVPDSPRWLAVHPRGLALYVSSGLGPTVTRVDLLSGEVAPVAVPGARRLVEGEWIDLVPRFTGDPAVTPQGDALAAPALYVDGETVEPPPESGSPLYAAEDDGLDVDQLNPSVVDWDLDEGGAPVGDGSAWFVTSRVGDVIARSMFVAVAPTEDGARWLLAMEGSDAVLSADRASAVFGPPSGGDGFHLPSILSVLAPGGPRGFVVPAGDGAPWVHLWLDRGVARVVPDVFAEVAGTDLVPSALSPAVDRGRRLFHSAVDRRMVAFGGGVSCSTCHFGGRTDGLVWPLAGGPRNTPSLAGGASDTAPFTWTDDVATVADEAFLTVTLRMGGDGITAADLQDLQAYVDSLRPVAAAPADPGVLALGQAAFVNAGCAECHGGEAYTDSRVAQVLDVPVQTPSLRGVAATAPYFHDGSAATLAEVLTTADGRMGDARALDEASRTALEAYLRSL